MQTGALPPRRRGRAAASPPSPLPRRRPDDVRAWGLLSHDQSDDLRWLYNLRVKADYYEDHVSLEEASDALEIARTLVESALAEASR